ncbi:ABC transporter substrate-binding protein [Magnetococcales bacterium HHB-1]
MPPVVAAGRAAFKKGKLSRAKQPNPSTSRKTAWLIILVLAVFVGSAVAYLKQDQRELFYIGLAAPISGPHAALGQAMKQGAELAIEQINQSSDLGDVALKLVVVDDQSKKKSRYRPREAAKTLVKQENLLGVVGHYFDVATQGAGEVYQRHKIPLLAPSVSETKTTAENSWAFSLLFNSKLEGSFLAQYVLHALDLDLDEEKTVQHKAIAAQQEHKAVTHSKQEKKVAHKETEKKGHKRALKLSSLEAFLPGALPVDDKKEDHSPKKSKSSETFLPEPVSVLYSSDVFGKDLFNAFKKEMKYAHFSRYSSLKLDTLSFEAKDLTPHVGVLGQSQVIVLLMDEDQALEALKFIRNWSLKAQVIGPHTLGSEAFIQKAGIYADRLYAVTPFPLGLLGQDARFFQQNFQQRFQSDPDWVAAYSYEAVKLFAKAIEKQGPERLLIRKYFKKLRNRQHALPSVAGDIFFNRQGVNQRQISIGQVKYGHFVPARYQLTYVAYPEILDKEEKKELFEFNHQQMKRRFVVFTGMDIKEVSTLDVNAGEFTVNFTVWFRWFGDDKFEFQPVAGKIDHQQVIEEYRDEKKKDNYVAYDVVATFLNEFPLHDYPMDKQRLRIRIEPKDQPAETLVLVSDLVGVNFERSSTSFGNWIDGGHLSFIDTIKRDFSYRNPQYKQKRYSLDYSIFTYDVHLERNSLQYVITYFPLALIVLISAMVFFLEPDHLDSRLALGITCLLTAMAFQMSQDVSVGYLIKADVFFIVTYIFIFLSIIQTVVAGFYESVKDDHATAKKMDIFFQYFYPLTFVASVTAVFLY